MRATFWKATMTSMSIGRLFQGPWSHKGICDGGQGQNRTADTRIFSPLLYRLSYLAEGTPYARAARIKRQNRGVRQPAAACA